MQLPNSRDFDSRNAGRDHGGARPLVLFVFESAQAGQTFVEVAATLDHTPFVSTHTAVLTEQGVLGESWRLPLPQPPGRQSLHDLGAVQTSPSTRPERFL